MVFQRKSVKGILHHSKQELYLHCCKRSHVLIIIIQSDLCDPNFFFKKTAVDQQLLGSSVAKFS